MTTRTKDTVSILLVEVVKPNIFIAGGEMPVIADGDGEQKEKYGHSLLEGKCLLLWHRKMRKRRCTCS